MEEQMVTLEFHHSSGLLQESPNNGQQRTIVLFDEDPLNYNGYLVVDGIVCRELGVKHFPKNCWHIVNQEQTASEQVVSVAFTQGELAGSSLALNDAIVFMQRRNASTLVIQALAELRGKLLNAQQG